jgi:glycosyltransferase involved in cell wall biosynthesis
MSNNHSEILLSVIVPVYNTAGFVAECLDSVLNQSHENLEVICVDDGSTDDSLKVLNQFQRMDSRVHVISQKNTGAGGARNTGVKCAKGKYLMFLDSDDYWTDENCCEVFIDLCERHSLDVLQASFDEMKNSVPNTEDIQNLHPSEGQQAFSLREIYLSNCTKIFRTDFFVQNNLFELEGIYFEDLLTSFKALAFAKLYIHVPIPFYRYRIDRIGSVTNESKNNQSDKELHKFHSFRIVWGYLIDFLESSNPGHQPNMAKHAVQKLNMMHDSINFQSALNKKKFTKVVNAYRIQLRSIAAKSDMRNWRLQEKVLIFAPVLFWSILRTLYRKVKIKT